MTSMFASQVRDFPGTHFDDHRCVARNRDQFLLGVNTSPRENQTHVPFNNLYLSCSENGVYMWAGNLSIFIICFQYASTPSCFRPKSDMFSQLHHGLHMALPNAPGNCCPQSSRGSPNWRFEASKIIEIHTMVVIIWYELITDSDITWLTSPRSN